MSNTQIEINFDHILDIAVRGMRRASVFMGLGVNAAMDNDFTNYQLTHLTKIQLVPNVEPEAISHFKDEFKIWIEANGFRELVEAFSKYLDELHKACLLIAKGKWEQQRNFELQGFPNKLNLLQAGFSVGPKHAEYLKSLNRARNCLTHRRGLVGQEDLTDGGPLSVLWLGMDIFVETPNGEKHMLNTIPEGGVFLPDGGSVKVQMVERERTFAFGTQVKFSTLDLAEICLFFDRESRLSLTSAIEFAKNSGVSVN